MGMQDALEQQKRVVMFWCTTDSVRTVDVRQRMHEAEVTGTESPFHRVLQLLGLSLHRGRARGVRFVDHILARSTTTSLPTGASIFKDNTSESLLMRCGVSVESFRWVYTLTRVSICCPVRGPSAHVVVVFRVVVHSPHPTQVFLWQSEHSIWRHMLIMSGRWIVSASRMSFAVLIAFEKDSPRSVSSLGLVAPVAKGQSFTEVSPPHPYVLCTCRSRSALVE